MVERKSSITKTNIRKQLDIAWGDVMKNVFNQLDWGLYWSGWDEIVTPVNRVTSQLDVRDCVIDIKELL